MFLKKKSFNLFRKSAAAILRKSAGEVTDTVKQEELQEEPVKSDDAMKKVVKKQKQESTQE